MTKIYLLSAAVFLSLLPNSSPAYAWANCNVSSSEKGHSFTIYCDDEYVARYKTYKDAKMMADRIDNLGGEGLRKQAGDPVSIDDEEEAKNK